MHSFAGRHRPVPGSQDEGRGSSLSYMGGVPTPPQSLGEPIVGSAPFKSENSHSLERVSSLREACQNRACG